MQNTKSTSPTTMAYTKNVQTIKTIKNQKIQKLDNNQIHEGKENNLYAPNATLSF